MIIYSSTKKGFQDDILLGKINERVLSSYVREVGRSNISQINSWNNSLQFMNTIMYDPEIPEDVGIAIEYKIPRTNNRIDFIVTGCGENTKGSAVIIELKQWSEGISLTEKDGVVETNFFGEVLHPSYQAWSYSTLIEDYNEDVRDKQIYLKPCAYLHNYEKDNILNNIFFKEYLEKAPVFYKDDAKNLQNFIKKYIKKGDSGEVLYTFENGRVKPSKSLADSLVSMINNNQEFVLIDDQKITFEKAISLVNGIICNPTNKKNVLIVEGGPGTGKTVVAINLLVESTSKGLFSQYVTKNSAPREVYKYKLTGKLTKTKIDKMFCNSGGYIGLDRNSVDVLIVDEAHRLTEKSGLFNNLGENQVKELINAGKLTIFFIDENQQVTIRDIGTKGIIEYYTHKLNANVHYSKLESQFRCNGSDGYLAWIDDVLQIRDTANNTLEGINFDFRVIDDPTDLYQLILKQNKVNNKSRLVAGYCWNWVSSKDSELNDINIGNFSAKWNLKSDGQSWLIKENSVEQIGCIHTCQGLELDYIGVIIGPDLIVRNGKIITDSSKRAKTDQSLKGLKKFKNDDQKIIADKIIKNTYRTLLTRGMKGCYIHCTDKETQEYFKNKLSGIGKESLYTNISDGTSVNTDN